MSEHLSKDLIFRTLDDELTALERSHCELHLAKCEECRREVASLQQMSVEIEAMVQSTAISSLESNKLEEGRLSLQRAIENQRPCSPAILQHPGKVMRRFGWGMAIAATLALGVLIAPKHDFTFQREAVGSVASAAQVAAIEVDGESFTPVPYSNADLPMAAPHIVEMQVPISSLADVGIVLEPVTNHVGNSPDNEGSVLADVLVGADGQPRGVHVLSFE